VRPDAHGLPETIDRFVMDFERGHRATLTGRRCNGPVILFDRQSFQEFLNRSGAISV
jgi:hypothetical protein